VPQLFPHRFAYIFQNVDRRIVFAIPYEEAFTLIGTTDVDFHGDPGGAHIDADEILYLCATVNRYFKKQLAPQDVELDEHPAPLLSVFGGKLTTYRKLAETAVDRLETRLGRRGGHWTAGAFLPGGDFTKTGLRGGAQPAGFAAFLRTVERRYPWLPASLRTRLSRAYGTRIERVIGNSGSLQDMGDEVLPGLLAREIEYLCAEEWAQTAEDILWRRSKLGLHLPHDAAARLDDWLT
jgi:glycerol-3-phosphate dehydrogenase